MSPAGLADYLQRRHSLYLNGVVLISPALSMQTYIAGGLNDLDGVFAGAFNLTTTVGTRYVLDHLNIDPALRKNLAFAEYPGGHMMYMHEPSLARLKKDLAAFYASAVRK